jgi:hypothetical protein
MAMLNNQMVYIDDVPVKASIVRDSPASHVWLEPGG